MASEAAASEAAASEAAEVADAAAERETGQATTMLRRRKEQRSSDGKTVKFCCINMYFSAIAYNLCMLAEQISDAI